MRHALVVCVALVALTPNAEARCNRCPWVNPHRTPQQAFDARNAALAAGDLDAAFCAYDDDAVVMMPGSVVRGRENIQTAFLAFGSLFGGQFPTITSTTEADDVLLVTYTITGPTLSITDGADTFVVRRGRISRQVVHATLTPTLP
jgi:ketosteroid isomerase-like protein